MRRALCLLLLLPVLATAGTIYKHTDANGKTVYTDQPPEGAQAVDLPPINTVLGGKPTAAPPVAPASATPAAAFTGYQSLTVEGVGQGQVLQNFRDSLTITAVPTPALQDGHRLLLTLNGRPVSDTGSYEIVQAQRGEYLFGASIVDDRGNVLIEATPLKFQVQQPVKRRP